MNDNNQGEKGCSVAFTCEGGIFECQREDLLAQLKSAQDEYRRKVTETQDKHDALLKEFNLMESDYAKCISERTLREIKCNRLTEALNVAREAIGRCMFELDKCTNGHVVDPHRRALAIEAYIYGRNALAKISSLTKDVKSPTDEVKG